MSEMLKDFPGLESILSGASSLGGKMTVFMPSDLTITNLRDETRNNIFVNQSDKALLVGVILIVKMNIDRTYEESYLLLFYMNIHRFM
jgi:hypothetical protein